MKGQMPISMLVLSTILFYTCSLVPLFARANPIHHNSASAVLDHAKETEERNEEEQLEKLKTIPDNVAMSKTQTKTVTTINGKTETHQTKEEKVKDAVSGQTISKISQHMIQTMDSANQKPRTVLKTEIDIPSKGIHEVTVNKKAKKQKIPEHGDVMSAEITEDYYLPYDGVQYSPSDMAEYIRRTGDDEGVALAIEELMREGLMSRNDAAAYLKEVKNEIEFLQQQEQYVKNAERNTRGHKQQIQRHQSLYLQQNNQHDNDGKWNNQQLTSLSQQQQKQQHSLASASSTSAGHNAAPSSDFHISTSESQKRSKEGSLMRKESELLTEDGRQTDSKNAINYNDLLERLRIADFLYKEYSLEEVIYQLAKEMFTQSIIKGNRDAEESLQRFSNFLQDETIEGRISKDLETKILDVVMAALMDSVGNHQEQQKGSLIPTLSKSKIGPINVRSSEVKSDKGPNGQSREDHSNAKNVQNKEQILYDKSKA